jgi:PAS domain S-box-containing protein
MEKNKQFLFFCRILLLVLFFFSFLNGRSYASHSNFSGSLYANTNEHTFDSASIESAEPERSQIKSTDITVTEDSLSGDETSSNEGNRSVQSSVAPKQVILYSKDPFYKKWWFTILLLLIAVPFVYKNRNRKEKEYIREIKIFNLKIEELKSELKEKEIQFKKSEDEFMAQIAGEKELKFQMVGLSKFSDLISQNKSDLKILGQQLIFALIEYIEANSGAIYILNDLDEKEKSLELLSSYASDISQVKKSFGPGEGYVGTCFSESAVLQLDNVPDSYAKISSGLGKSLPKFLVFVPLKLDERNLGVLEIASFAKIENYKLDFVVKLSQNIASTFAITQANQKNFMMLEQSREQSEELRSQEEELRQNLEEMQATQEDLNRQVQANKKMQDDLLKEKALLDSIMRNLPDYIYFKDKDSKFIRISHSMLKLFPVDKLEEMIGKSDFDFHTKENAQKYYDEEQEIIKSGKGFIDQLQHEFTENGVEQWISATKLPLTDEEGNPIGTFGISKNITVMKNLELEANLKAEELMAQEEELRQNLEEMQTIQEDLQRNIAENKKMQAKLIKEKALLDALLNNLPDYIYFKDKNSQFLRISKSMLQLFPVKTLDEMIGKSDFDFHSKKNARKYYEEEQEIIKSGQGFIDKIQHEVTENGVEQWVASTKMPFYDETGKCVGVFGISKNITAMKNLEMDANLKAEELSAQEEELRQNLEEMQTIQEDLHRNIAENLKMQEKLIKEKALLDALLNNLPDYIYFKDENSQFIRISKSMLRLFPVETLEEMIGKSDFDFHTKENAQKYFDEEQQIIKSGQGFIDQLQHEVTENGVDQWVNSTKMPFYDETGKCVGVFGISKNVSELKKLEMEANLKAEELMSQEEELRQNLEEMQSIQEDLQRRIKENEKMKSDFQSRERELLETIEKLKK